MRTTAIREAEKILPSLVQEAIGGEEVLITVDHAVVAKLVGVVSAKTPRPQFGSARGLMQKELRLFSGNKEKQLRRYAIPGR